MIIYYNNVCFKKTKEVQVKPMRKLYDRTVALLLAIVLLISMMPEALAASYAGTINEDKVFFRMKPNTSSDYYTLLKKGTSVSGRLLNICSQLFGNRNKLSIHSSAGAKMVN